MSSSSSTRPSGEESAIAAASAPVTTDSLLADLSNLGISEGDIVIVHSSLSAMGWVSGGAQAVVMALLAAVGPSGTIIMPTQSGHLSDPALWEAPPVPVEWHQTIRDTMPAFDPHLTLTRKMGQIVDTFLRHPDTIRSSHPALSFAANGPQAALLMADHPLVPGFGEGSPLAKLYELDATILLIGVGHGNNTSLHLAEHRASWSAKSSTELGAPMTVDGNRQWVTYTDLDIDEDDFPIIGEALAQTDIEQVGKLGTATARRMSQRAVVDFAVRWMEAHR